MLLHKINVCRSTQEWKLVKIHLLVILCTVTVLVYILVNSTFCPPLDLQMVPLVIAADSILGVDGWTSAKVTLKINIIVIGFK